MVKSLRRSNTQNRVAAAATRYFGGKKDQHNNKNGENWTKNRLSISRGKNRYILPGFGRDHVASGGSGLKKTCTLVVETSKRGRCVVCVERER